MYYQEKIQLDTNTMNSKSKKFLLCGIFVLTNYGGIPLLAEASLGAQKNYYVSQTVHKNWLSTTTKVAYYNNRKEIGHLYYEQLPLSIVVIHTFFVEPSYRNNGYGTCLLHMVCKEIKNGGARMIVIQPGPFEHVGQEFKPVTTNRSERLEQLVRLYTKVGFTVAPHILRYLAACVYKLARLDEDAHYLMIQ
ncbi:hypothetical protein Noda2021_03510 [Candidatus Dependentiae bacterium Noda2021]|nr:hypothetical protein Noda2021_03510 [Candidatus Dependentiae bacterium Noda2021]